MTKRTFTLTNLRPLALAALVAAALLLWGAPAALAQTAGGTPISNTASAEYFDAGGNRYDALSNTVTVTVANVAGLAITPDGGGGTVVAGNTNASVTFTVSNTGNFADTVTFKAGGASLIIGGAIAGANVIEAFYDHNGNGSFNVADGDVNIWTNAGPVNSASIPAGQSRNVVVRYGVPAGASGSVNIQLGDAGGASPFDNQTLVVSAADVANTTAGVNGRSEARGLRSYSVLRDAAIQTTLTGPAGPINPGSDVSYAVRTCNISPTQAASARTLTNAPAGSNSGIFEIFPIPAQTALKAGQTFPAGTLYSVSPLTDNPVSVAVWTTSAPADLTTVRRIALNRGATLAANNTCTSDVTVLVTINASANADIPVLAIADSFAQTRSATASPTSRATAPPTSARRADLSPLNSNPDGSNLSAAGDVDGDGVLILTLIGKLGAVLNGPNGAPGATGPTNNNDDYTNRSVTTGIAGVAPGGSTTAAGSSTFTNTVQNTGNANDVFTLTVSNFASLPAGSSLLITTPSGSVTVNGANPTAASPSASRAALRPTNGRLLARLRRTVLTPFAAIIRATRPTPGLVERHD